MGLLNTLLEAAALGVQAKASKDANARAQRRAEKAHAQCTPCAAGAKVEQYGKVARERLGVPARGARR